MHGLGVLVVGAFRGFVWYEYKDAVELLETTVDELRIAKKAFSQQTEINVKLGARLKQVQAVASSLVELAEQDRPDQGQNQDDFKC